MCSSVTPLKSFSVAIDCWAKQFQEAFPLQGPGAAYLKFYFARPRSHYSTKKGQIADARPDAQIFKDAISREGRNGCSDAVTCVAHLSITKVYAKYSGTNIQIHELTEAKHEQPAHRD